MSDMAPSLGHRCPAEKSGGDRHCGGAGLGLGGELGVRAVHEAIRIFE
jgi:hypothetical protein